MKPLLLTSALVAAFAVVPAWAQQGNANGTVTVQGVKPAEVLGAIDTSKLVDNPQYGTQASSQAVTAQSATTGQPGNLSGEVTVQGVKPSKVLGAIDTAQLVDRPSPAPQISSDEKWPAEAHVVSRVVEGDKATGTTVTTTEVVEPVYPARTPNPFKTISPEAQAAVDAGHDNTNALIQAQLDALGKTPPVQPTTTIVTTETTPPRPGG